MNQFDISGDMTRKPNFLESIQNTHSGPKLGVSIFGENFVGQQAQSAHHVPAVNQDKALCLKEVEFLHQSLQQQQTLVESLTEQLVRSQEQIAQMERDFALLQQRYAEQRHLHKNAEANCQNLRTRLCRQQHLTLQFKAALEECLETSRLDQRELGFGRTYSTIESAQPLLQSLTGHQPLPKADLISIRTLGLADTSLSNQAHGVNIGASMLSSDTKVDTCRAITLNVEGEASLEETNCSQEIVFPVRSPHPSSFQGQSVQPWSAPQSLDADDVEKQQQEQSIGSICARHKNAASTIQAEAAKTPRPSEELVASTDSIKSSPLLEPLLPPSRRKPIARVELPPLPRCWR